MKDIILLSLSLFVFSCSLFPETEDRYGTQLESIEFSDRAMTWNEDFFYDSNRMTTMKSSDKIYELVYEKDRIIEIRSIKQGASSANSKDSILYNENGTIQAVYNMSRNADNRFVTFRVNSFEYDYLQQMVQRWHIKISSQDTISSNKYFWKGSNIDKVEYYNSNNGLEYTSFFNYDNKLNYRRQIPTDLQDPISWSENNVVKIKWEDPSGRINIDCACETCRFDYTYNLDNYPVEIEMNNGTSARLNYR